MTALSGQELELSDYTQHLMDAADVRPGERVVDVGCGTGGPTVAAAYRAAPGAVVGIDVHAASIATARSRIPQELTNLSYAVADAATQRPLAGPVDGVISRFGVMFFDDPDAAFTNLASWLRPGGRLAALVWQPQDVNPWILETNRALTGDPAGTGIVTSGPFSLREPDLVSRLLTGAGFTDVAITPVHEQVHLGASVPDALGFVLSWRSSQEALAAVADDVAERLRLTLTVTLARHLQDDGRVSLPSAAWLVRARRAG